MARVYRSKKVTGKIAPQTKPLPVRPKPKPAGPGKTIGAANRQLGKFLNQEDARQRAEFKKKRKK